MIVVWWNLSAGYIVKRKIDSSSSSDGEVTEKIIDMQ